LEKQPKPDVEKKAIVKPELRQKPEQAGGEQGRKNAIKAPKEKDEEKPASPENSPAPRKSSP
jgi:hypothetical protein